MAPKVRQHASRACVLCRQRRKKCDGPDCSTCSKENVECVMDLDTDQRRNARRNLPHQLLARFRTLPLSEAQTLLDAIRSGDQDLATLLDELPPSYSGASVSSSSSQALSTAKGQEQPELAMRAEAETSTSHGSSRTSSYAVDDISMMDGMQLENDAPHHVRLISPDLPMHSGHSFPRLLEVVLSFREAAASEILSGGYAQEILSMSGLGLELLYRDRLANDGHTVSTWACEFARVSKLLSPVSQLTVVYFAGAFMRWLVIPCKETYDLLPPLMQPMVRRSTTYSHLEIESSNARAWEWIHDLTVDKTRLQWPYPALACLDETYDPSAALRGPGKTFSVLFMDHCNDLRNWLMGGQH